MRRKRWASGLLAGGTLLAVALMPTTAANAAAQTLTIPVGGDSMIGGDHGVLLEGMRFGAPSNMTVHKGDTITFAFRGFHTATLLPVGEGPQDWRADHTGLAGDYSLVQPDADDGAGVFKLNTAVLFGSDPSCGVATSPCVYDGKSIVNSGVGVFLDPPEYSVTINANPGESFWVLCLIHAMMQTRITVVPDNEATTTQTAIDAYTASTAAADQEEATALLPRLNTPTSHKVNGTKVWDAYAGYDGDGWGLDGMFPKKLKIAKGETVRWHFAQLLDNIHSVTFPKSRVNALGEPLTGSMPVCEADPTDTPPELPGPPFCNDPTALEFHVPATSVLPQGSDKYRGTGLRSSGIEGPGAISTAPYDLTFTKRTDKHGFKYACIIHGTMMSGRVVVK